jgi:acyl carrier protein
MNPDRKKEITDALRRCSNETLAAALRFQSTHTDEDLAIIINGVLERDLPDTHVAELAAANDNTLLIEGLGMDSFGMIEVVMTAEIAFGITICNEDLRDIHTLGSLKNYLLGNVHQTYFGEVDPLSDTQAPKDPL